MGAAVIALAAIVLLVIEMARPVARGPIPTSSRVMRSIPFVVASALSLWVAGRAPLGRKPFQIDMSLSAEDLALSMTKVPHFRTIAILFLLAAVAVGSRRLLLAFGLTMLIGAGWEIAEATVIGHHGRLADLAPDLIAALAAFVLTMGLRRLVGFVAARRRIDPADVLPG